MSLEDRREKFFEGAVALSAAMRARFGGAFFDGEDDVWIGMFEVPGWGESVVYKVEGVIYALDPSGELLLAVRFAHGAIAWTWVGEDGAFGHWRRQAPPPAVAGLN